MLCETEGLKLQSMWSEIFLTTVTIYHLIFALKYKLTLLDW